MTNYVRAIDAIWDAMHKYGNETVWSWGVGHLRMARMKIPDAHRGQFDELSEMDTCPHKAGRTWCGECVNTCWSIGLRVGNIGLSRDDFIAMLREREMDFSYLFSASTLVL
jgi:hypothetical protein